MTRQTVEYKFTERTKGKRKLRFTPSKGPYINWIRLWSNLYQSIFKRACVHAHMHVHVRMHTCTYMCVRAHTHTHTHTHQSPSNSSSLTPVYDTNRRPLRSLTEKAVAPHSSTLAWKIPWTQEPGRLQSMGSLRVRHN